MSEFFRTQMGHRFYESTMPSLVRELARLNDEPRAAPRRRRARRRRPDEGEHRRRPSKEPR
jgi:hypothetical protein